MAVGTKITIGEQFNMLAECEVLDSPMHRTDDIHVVTGSPMFAHFSCRAPIKAVCDGTRWVSQAKGVSRG